MILNNKIKIVISEPWDFSSSDGENILFCQKIREIDNYGEKLILLKVTSKVIIDYEVIDYLLITRRNSIDYYIFKVDSTNLETNFIIKNLKTLNFLMIGRLT